MFALGVAAIWVGGSRLPETGKLLAECLGISATTLGLFVLSIVTSLPELAVTLWAMIGESAPDLALGNVIGSNNFNLTCIVALQVGFGGVLLHRVGSARYLRTCAALMAMTALVGVGIVAGGVRGPALGSVLLFGLPIVAVFVYDTVTHRNVMRKDDTAESACDALRDNAGGAVQARLLLRFLLLTIAVVLGGFLTARGANGIAVHPFERLGEPFILGHTFVGTLLVAVATSMPEVSVAYSAVRRASSPDMALGTLLGSNTINILVFVVGTPLLALRFSESAWRTVSDANLVSVSAALLMTLMVVIGIISRRWARGKMFGRATTMLLVPVYVVCVFLVYRWS
jgi:cation:H+ antiporter